MELEAKSILVDIVFLFLSALCVSSCIIVSSCVVSCSTCTCESRAQGHDKLN